MRKMPPNKDEKRRDSSRAQQDQDQAAAAGPQRDDPFYDEHPEVPKVRRASLHLKAAPSNRQPSKHDASPTRPVMPNMPNRPSGQNTYRKQAQSERWYDEEERETRPYAPGPSATSKFLSIRTSVPLSMNLRQTITTRASVHRGADSALNAHFRAYPGDSP